MRRRDAGRVDASRLGVGIDAGHFEVEHLLGGGLVDLALDVNEVRARREPFVQLLTVHAEDAAYLLGDPEGLLELAGDGVDTLGLDREGEDLPVAVEDLAALRS